MELLTLVLVFAPAFPFLVALLHVLIGMAAYSIKHIHIRTSVGTDSSSTSSSVG
jgi:hypothetical protein